MQGSPKYEQMVSSMSKATDAKAPFPASGLTSDSLI